MSSQNNSVTSKLIASLLGVITGILFLAIGLNVNRLQYYEERFERQDERIRELEKISVKIDILSQEISDLRKEVARLNLVLRTHPGDGK